MNHTAKNASLASHHSKVFTDPSLKEVHTHGTKEQPMTGIHFKCGYDTIYPDHFFVDRHWHRTVEIILIIKGSYELSGKDYPSLKDKTMLYFLTPQEYKKMKKIKKNADALFRKKYEEYCSPLPVYATSCSLPDGMEYPFSVEKL